MSKDKKGSEESISQHNLATQRGLWKAFCSGDERAFSLIYNQYVQDLFNFGFQLSKNRELTKDIIQDVFIDLRCAKQLREVTSIKSYLFKCFYTEWIRRSKQAARFSPLNDHYSVTMSFEDKLIADQTVLAKQELLKSRLNMLTNKQRKAVMLFYFEGFTYSQLAEALGLKGVKSARKLIYRALTRLKTP